MGARLRQGYSMRTRPSALEALGGIEADAVGFGVDEGGELRGGLGTGEAAADDADAVAVEEHGVGRQVAVLLAVAAIEIRNRLWNWCPLVCALGLWGRRGEARKTNQGLFPVIEPSRTGRNVPRQREESRLQGCRCRRL